MMDPTQMLSLAMQHHRAGDLREAESLYRQFLHANPGHVDALHMLGVLAYQSGQFDSAVDHIRQALRLHPNFPAAYNNLGIALKAQGKLDEAIISFHEALRVSPSYADVYYNLGNALIDQGKLDQAIAAYQQAVHLQPSFANAFVNLAHVLKDQGKLEDSISCLEQVLRVRPDDADTHNRLGAALIELGKLDEAIASFRTAVRLQPAFAGAHNNLGNALASEGRLDEAVACYRQALQLMPEDADTQGNLGIALTELGRREEAAEYFRKTLRSAPNHAEALYQLASMLRNKLTEKECALLERRLTEPGLPDIDRVKLLHGLIEMCDAKGEYARAASLVREANALTLNLRRRAGKGYDPDKHAHWIDALIQAFTPAFFERLNGFGSATDRPVFIVGLPRSGTTLTEQVLAAHSQVHGAGELMLARADFRVLTGQLTEDNLVATLSKLSGKAIAHQSQWHLDQLRALSGTARRVVDKMPDNYLYLGLLAVMFPRAKFIHCCRDLRDVAVSCWMTNFRDFHWANDPTHIATRFREYQRLMTHWRAVLPVSVLDVQYEETVADLPGVAKRLVEWCGLDWEPACVDFHKGGRPVRTASKNQVREAVYTRSVSRWRHYEKEMSELFTALASATRAESIP
jgi:tetratricopeptide (TPR) repeat protein